MQIDMHYYGTYALARMAGIKAGAARIIATASQYVDDAVSKEIRIHEDGNRLFPVVTAHQIIEIVENRNENDQRFVWMPFHFFPGNKGNDFSSRLICEKDGALINEILNHYLALDLCAYSLELLGIAVHIYADTFAHYGFSGASSRKNRVKGDKIRFLNASDPSASHLSEKMDSFFRRFGRQGGLWANFRRNIISDGAEVASGALGHGAVAIFPDTPYLQWEFEYEFNGQDVRPSVRDNTATFLEGCEKIHDVFQRFVNARTAFGDNSDGVEFNKVKNEIEKILSYQNGKEERAEKWRATFASGKLGVPAGEEIPLYSEKIWDKQREHFPGLADPAEVTRQEVYHFYQAADYHLRYVLRELFPRQGLVVV